jgi:two-component system, chemotaxis family, chemotaxis protein CheY
LRRFAAPSKCRWARDEQIVKVILYQFYTVGNYGREVERGRAIPSSKFLMEKVLHPPKALRILVVEDETLMRQLVCEMLRSMGIDVIEHAPSGEVALAKISPTRPFDLVVFDWNMPKMSGLELLKRARGSSPDTMFLMTTGRTDLRSVQEARAAGVAGYLVKPFSPVQLREKVGALWPHALAGAWRPYDKGASLRRSAAPTSPDGSFPHRSAMKYGPWCARDSLHS